MNISEITHDLSVQLWPHNRNDTVSNWFDNRATVKMPDGFRLLQSGEDYSKHPNSKKLGPDDRKYAHDGNNYWRASGEGDMAWKGDYPGDRSGRAICLVPITQHDIYQLDEEKSALLQQELPSFLIEEEPKTVKKGRKIEMHLLDPAHKKQTVLIPVGSEIFAAGIHLGLTPAIYYVEGKRLKKNGKYNESVNIYIYRVGDEYPGGKMRILGTLDLLGETIFVFTDPK